MLPRLFAAALLGLALLALPAPLAAQAPRWARVAGLTEADGSPVGIGAIAFNAQNVKTVWFGATEDRLFVSHDGGLSARRFTQIPLGPTVPNGGSFGTITSIYVHPTDTLFMFVGSTTGVYLSRDGGRIWAPAPFPAATPLQNPVIAADPSFPDDLYIGHRGVFYNSVDRGRTWLTRPVVGRGFSRPALLTALLSRGGSELLAGMRAPAEIGRLELDAGGAFWTRMYEGVAGADTTQITTLATDVRDARFMWAAEHAQSGRGKLLFSDSRGAAWRQISIPGHAGINPWAVATDGRGRVLAGEHGHGPPGAHLTLDEGRTWQFVAIEGVVTGAVAMTRSIATRNTGAQPTIVLADERAGAFRLINIPDVPPRPSRVYPIAAELPLLSGGRIRGERRGGVATGRIALMGLQANGRPYAAAYAQNGENVRLVSGSSPPDTASYGGGYSGVPFPLGFWNGDALLDDFTGDGRTDIVISGNTAPESLAVTPQTHFYSDAVGQQARLTVALPHVYASRLAGRSDLVAIAGRGATGLLLEVYRVVRAATPTFTRVATLPGLEAAALALGDCDGDGDGDLFATGADALGLPVATLYRNDGNTFSPVRTLPGTFRGDAAFGDLDGDGVDDLAYSGYQYGPGDAEGHVYAYRMNGCAPTPLPIPAEMQRMMGETVALDDFDLDGTRDLIVAGFDGAFRDRNAFVRITRTDKTGALLLNVNQKAFGFGGATFSRMGGPVVAGLPPTIRPGIIGVGLSGAQPIIWGFTRPYTGPRE